MLWIPGIDEIPLSVMDANEKNQQVTVAVKKIGVATEAIHRQNVGDRIGIRGPFGNSFTESAGNVMMVAGGTGVAPILFQAKKLGAKADKLVLVLGAKTKSELLMMKEFEGLATERKEIVASTEDGTCGITGLCTDVIEGILSRDSFDRIYACGPELMIAKVFEQAERHHVSMEASLERLMRCAVGLCGTCVLGKYRVCSDGPVFTSERLREVRAELGVSKRDFDGRKISLCS